jgi:transaldolase
MKFFLDTAEIDKIKKWNDLGMVDGITTNPSLIAKAGRDHEQAIKEICKMVKGPVSVEGAGTTSEEIVKESEEFATWGKNVVAKVPMTVEGLKACMALRKKGIPVNVTLVFSAAQAILAAKAGATYVSPFIGRLDDVGECGMDLIEEIVQIYANYEFETQVLVASVRSPLHVVEAGLAGAKIVTMPPDVLEKMYKHPFTDAGMEKFLADYKASKKR